MIRRWSQKSATVMASSGIEYAAATSTFGGNSKNCQSIVVITWKRPGSAMRAGTPNSAMASRKATMKAARIAGSVRGSVMRSVRRTTPAPSVVAASSISEEIRSSAPRVKTKT